MTTSDQRMIELIDRLQAAGTIATRQDFLDVIGMLKQNYTEVVNGRRSFRVEHITKACKEYGVNANWILGLDDKVFSRRKPVVEEMYGSNKKSNKGVVGERIIKRA